MPKQERSKRVPPGSIRRPDLFLNSIIENIPHVIFVKDARTLRFLRLNKAGEILLGYKRKELLGKNDYDFFPKSEADFFAQKDREILKKRSVTDIPEMPIHTRHRGLRVLHTKKIPILDKKGRPLYLLGISEDITDVKKAEEKLQMYADIVRNIQIGFLIWRLEDPEDAGSFRLVDANPTASEVTGVDMNMFIGKTIREGFPDFLKTGVPMKYLQAVKTGEKLDLEEIRYGDKNIKESDFSIKVFPLPNQCIGVAYENITEKKNIEQQTLNLVEKEQDRIGQDLHDGLSQDLTAIAFLSKGLENRIAGIDRDAAKDLKMILSLVNKSIDKTKNLARGLYPVELQSDGLAESLQSLAKRMEEIYKIPIETEIKIDDTPLKYETANHLYRLAQEAVINAIKHSNSKRIKIDLSGSHAGIILTVWDDGVGLPENVSSLKNGMGLRLMEYRARMMGGTLTIASPNKKGTIVQCSVRTP